MEDYELEQSQTMNDKQLKSFLLGLLVSVLIILSFFIGGLADRVFVIRPLDKLAPFSKRNSLSFPEGQIPDLSDTSLGQMMKDGSYSVADVAQKASESVVTISIRTQQRVIDPSSIFGNFGFFGFREEEVRLEEIERDIGTGFVVESSLIVTNRHVVGDPNAEYRVVDDQDKEYEVTEIYRDPSLDLAILRVADFEAPALPLGDSDQIRVGEPVIAIGTALGQFRHTVTTGVVSGVGRSITAAGGGQFEDLQNVIQTDAAINPGNSGGPLISSRGEVIGINVATAAAENVSFAIPINVLKAVIENFNETGQFDRPMLGISYTVISEQAALMNEVPQGAYVLEVLEGSTAQQAGIQPQDIIVEFDGEKISEELDLAQLINQQKVGTSVSVRIWRQGEFQNLNLTLRSRQN